MTGTIFVLALLAALNPKLLGADLLLVDNVRARQMFLCFLLGCLGMALTIGLLDVFVLQSDAISTQGSASAGLDLFLGVPLLAVGVLIATGRLHGRRKAPAPAGAGQPRKKDGWAQRVLREPRLGLAVLVGALCGTPGAAQTRPGLADDPRAPADSRGRELCWALHDHQRSGPAAITRTRNPPAGNMAADLRLPVLPSRGRRGTDCRHASSTNPTAHSAERRRATGL